MSANASTASKTWVRTLRSRERLGDVLYWQSSIGIRMTENTFFPKCLHPRTDEAGNIDATATIGCGRARAGKATLEKGNTSLANASPALTEISQRSSIGAPNGLKRLHLSATPSRLHLLPPTGVTVVSLRYLTIPAQPSNHGRLTADNVRGRVCPLSL